MNTVPSGSFTYIFLVNCVTSPTTIPLTYQQIPLFVEISDSKITGLSPGFCSQRAPSPSLPLLRHLPVPAQDKELRNTLAQQCPSLGAYQALSHWALQAAEECQDSLLPWKGGVWKASQWWLLACSHGGDVGMGLPWLCICHHPSVLEPAAVGAEPLSHLGLNNSGTALHKVLVLLVCLHRGEGCLKELLRHNMTFEFWDPSAGRDGCYRCPIYNLGSSCVSTIK